MTANNDDESFNDRRIRDCIDFEIKATSCRIINCICGVNGREP